MAEEMGNMWSNEVFVEDEWHVEFRTKYICCGTIEINDSARDNESCGTFCVHQSIFSHETFRFRR
jgi:hypothetical protein